MNPLLGKLHPYPFERLRALTDRITPNPALRPISLGIGEPRHATPKLIEDALVAGLKGLSVYPPTAGSPALREAFAGWVQRRYGVTVDAATQVLPVGGSREALFAIAQTVVDASRAGATVVCPNPFYQIYEGAALLVGAEVAYANSDPGRNFAADWGQIDEPTEGIQPSIIKDIAKALNEIRKMRDITIVVSEQVLSFALDVADRLFVIEGGRLVHETRRADTDVAHIKQYLSV